MADDWHKFFQQAWTKAGSGLEELVDGMKRSFVESVDDLKEQGLSEQDAVLWVLDLAEASGGPMRLLESWAMELWPDIFWEEDDEE